MNNRSYLAAGALSLGLFLAASAALAQPYGKGGAYSMVPAPQAAERGHRPHHADCQCPMMKGEAAMRDPCMAMSGAHPESSAKPPSAG
jgi:hypothetical protein